MDTISSNGASALSPPNQTAAGKAARERVPRVAHGKVKLSPTRDPIGILRKSDDGRLPELVPIRYGRMLQ